MSSRFKVLVPDFLREAKAEESVLRSHADVVLLQAASEPEILDRIHEADAVIVFHDMQLTEASISRMERCRGIIRCGVGYDNVSLRAAGNRGIVVCNVPDYGTEEVADHAILMLLAIVRRLIPAHDSIRQGAWDPSIVYGTPRLRGRTLGLIGCGRIGTATALRAKALGLDVVFYDPYQPPGYEKAIGVGRSYRLEELLAQSDFISIHTPLTKETKHILGAQTLAYVKKGAYVVNTARGGCVDLDALHAALEDGRVAYAALDVVEKEPLDDPRFRNHPRVILTPHAAFYSVEGFVEMRVKAAEEAKRMFTGEPVRNPVNLHSLSNPRCQVPHQPPLEVK
ncbi:MAG: C-terminal binding protein [Planctomycetota bacterium]